jgi:hypothetical protein
MVMALASQMVAGDCVEHATAKEDGAYQDVEDVEHWFSPVSNKAAACGAHDALHTKLGGSAYSFDGTATDAAYKFYICARTLAACAE